MASRVIRFLPRQALAGNDSSSTDLYSNVFEVVNTDTLVVETRVFSAEPATATVTR